MQRGNLVSVLEQPLVFLDVETTGASPRTGAKITEIGALRVEHGKVVKTFKSLLNPGTHVPPFITRLTGISDDMLWDAPSFISVKDELELLLSDAIFVAHNVSFDYSFIKAEFNAVGENFKMDRLCTARLSRALYPEQARHNLDTLITAHHIPMVNRHRAFDDAQALHIFVKSALKEHGSKVDLAMKRLLQPAI
jgi:DNA polymerase-3 subunit epsilon